MICFFPGIGVVIGLLICGYGRLCVLADFGMLMRAAGFVLIPVLVTGGIHLDGMLDTIDALASYGTKEQKLEILKDPNSGAFAVIGGGCYFIGCLGLWSEVTVQMLPVIACGYVLSRGLSGLAVVRFPSASKKGLARTFKEGTKGLHSMILLVVFILAPVGVMLYLSPGSGGLAAAGAAGTFLCYRRMAIGKFGGVTGDLAGYFLQMCELVMLAAVVAAARMCALWC